MHKPLKRDGFQVSHVIPHESRMLSFFLDWFTVFHLLAK